MHESMPSRGEIIGRHPASIIAHAMDRAAELGWEAKGTTSPNPPVGAVIIDADGRIIGQGHTQPAGGPHAEVMAVRDAGDATAGATAVVTLEPCAHKGRTGPCTDVLLSAGISTVVYAVSDPNPIAHGGHKVLADAGLTVIGSFRADEVRRGALRSWLHRIDTGRAMVTLKVAATLDGRVAAPDGTSQWITSADARNYVHRDRATRDALIVGTGTVIADNPRLTARKPDGTLYAHQPDHVIIGSRSIAKEAKIFAHARSQHFDTHDLPHVIQELTQQGYVDLLIEGGPTLASAALEQGVVDHIHWYVAPSILGSGLPAIHIPHVSTLTDRRDFTIEHISQLGPDLLIDAHRQAEGSSE